MIKIQVTGIEGLQAFLKKLPVAMRKIAIKEAAIYLIGDDRRGLKHLVNYKYVSRKSAYGKTFQSDKQRRWFFWALKSGKINPGQDNRTGKTAESWKYTIRESGNNYQAKLHNATRGAYYVQGDKTQARQPAKVGHRKVSDVISTNIQGAIRAANYGINAWVKAQRK